MPVITPPTSATFLDRNLAAIARGSPSTARALRNLPAPGALDQPALDVSSFNLLGLGALHNLDAPATPPAPDIRFFATDDGVLSAERGLGTTAQALASRRRPLAEADKLIADIDPASAGVFVIAGFGLGYHVASLARRVKRSGLIVVFEPDVALLQAVFHNIDHTSWLTQSNVAILTDPDDAAAMSEAIQGLEAVIALGVKLIEHPQSRARLAAAPPHGAVGRFHANLVSIVEAVKMTVVTSLVQVRATMRNLLMNVDRYVESPGIDDLADACAGRPGIVVSAGPSLERNIDLLSRPGVRDRFAIIAVQTVLKTLLKRGIKPHFVTALDHSEIGRRFYEGLTAADVEGITLVVEPKVNPAVVEAFPGHVRCVTDKYLDALLGESFHRSRGTLPPGATVAHLCYYLARHLGCDPVAFIGQDLGFTDGQYYAAGAAIHDVWAGELNEFNTLEMLEWQRIVRMGTGPRGHLRRASDALGRPIFTDEQMSTYLVQFERDFRADTERGRTVFDCTEGGVRKRHTSTATLSDFIERFGGGNSAERPPALNLPACPAINAPSRNRVQERIREVRAQVWRAGELSRKAATLLSQMLDHHADQAKVNRLIASVDKARDEVLALQPGFDLVQLINQRGGFNRARADRELAFELDLPPLHRQRRQIERDVENVNSLALAADDLGSLLDQCSKVLDGAIKVTRDTAAANTAAPTATGGGRTPGAAICAKVIAVIPFDPQLSGLGTSHKLDQPLTPNSRDRRTPLRLTLERLSRCELLSAAVIVGPDPDAARAAIGLSGSADRLGSLELTFLRATLRPAHRSAAIGAARRWAQPCWRAGAGLAGATCFDEVLHTDALAAAITHPAGGSGGADAALLVGPDWCLVDPRLCDDVIRRHLEQPTSHRLTFTQAPPGLGGCVVARSLIPELAAAANNAGPLGTIGGLLGYLPTAPAGDLIAFPVCVPIDPAVRDAGSRFIADSSPCREFVAQLIERLGDGFLAVSAADIASAAAAERQTPHHLTLQIMADRPMETARAEQYLREFARHHDDAVITLSASAGADPANHSELSRLLRIAREAGFAGIHIRTPLLCPPEHLAQLFDADIISVDLFADTPATYAAVTGADRFAHVTANLNLLLQNRAVRTPPQPGLIPTPWIVPRITRCDAAYADIEPFFNRWIMTTGAAVIDPPSPPAAHPGDRIVPLPLPESARRRFERQSLTIDANA